MTEKTTDFILKSISCEAEATAVWQDLADTTGILVLVNTAKHGAVSNHMNVQGHVLLTMLMRADSKCSDQRNELM